MNDLDAKMDDLDAKNKDPIELLHEYILKLFALTSAKNNSLAIRELPAFYMVFEDILFKFDIFYKVIYQREYLNEQNIDTMMDTVYLEFIPSDFLIRLARCIRLNIQLDIDPESCFKPEQIHDFIRLLRVSVNKMINDISQVYSWYKDRNELSKIRFFKRILRILKHMQSIIENLEGEWYDNVEIVSPEANGELLFEGEYMDYDYVPPPANMF